MNDLLIRGAVSTELVAERRPARRERHLHASSIHVLPHRVWMFTRLCNAWIYMSTKSRSFARMPASSHLSRNASAYGDDSLPKGYACGDAVHVSVKSANPRV